MKLKNRLKYGIGEMGQAPWVARIARIRQVRLLLEKIPVVRALYDTGWARLHPFDRLHGIETSSSEELDAHLADQPSFPHAHFYAGSQPGLLRSVLRLIPCPESFTFVDLGCGKGRPLFVASEFPFREIVGVELSPRLAKLARRNATKMSRRYPGRAPVRVEIGDAGAYRFPAGNLVLFLYNPFGEAIILKVVAALERALATEPRRVYVIYYNPIFEHCFDQSPALSRLFTETIPHDRTELGFGSGTEDTLTLWGGGGASSLAPAGILRNAPSA